MFTITTILHLNLQECWVTHFVGVPPPYNEATEMALGGKLHSYVLFKNEGQIMLELEDWDVCKYISTCTVIEQNVLMTPKGQNGSYNLYTDGTFGPKTL